MSKEYLKALKTYLDKRIKDIKNYLEVNERSEDEEGFTPSEELQICYLAKRMLAIDNANPSEALDCLENMYTSSEDTIYQFEKEYKVIKQYILKAQEMEKENAELKRVLEIIKNKCVDIQLLKRSENWLDYYTRFKHRTGKNTEITQEEFDLLKRYFK